ncbi:MAG TPA: sugar transferase, partial [Phycisphaeraceae bacterium]
MKPVTKHRRPNPTPLPPSSQPPSPWFEPCKRAMDVLLASLGLIASAPVLLLCMAWVWWMDGSPVIYRQWRVGRSGRLFCLYKLRTMRRDAERHGVRLATSDDQRVLPGCQWIRKSHLDELPQLINVLMGQMSIVGPRPERPEVIEQLRAALPRIERRLAVAPGLTGLAQVRNGYSNDLAGMRRKLAYDLLYLRRRSFFTDLGLILQTAPKLWDQA